MGKSDRLLYWRWCVLFGAYYFCQGLESSSLTASGPWTGSSEHCLVAFTDVAKEASLLKTSEAGAEEPFKKM